MTIIILLIVCIILNNNLKYKMNLNIKQKVVDTINEARAKGITFSQMSIATGSNDRTLMTIKKMGCAYPMRESYWKRLIEEISKLKSFLQLEKL